jgi:SAM-dependent methyltransferase
MTETQTSTQERLDRERAFHNDRFDDGGNREHLDRWYLAVSHGMQAQREHLRKVCEGKVVLEYGCAYGETTLNEYRLHECAKEVHGIDLSDVAIEKAKARAAKLGVTNAFFRDGNAEAMPYEDETFDVIFGRGIIHHLDLNASFAELKRVLKPGGIISFYEPMGHNPVINWYRNRTPQYRTPDEHPIVESDFKLARKYFKEVNTEYFGMTTLVAVPLGGLLLNQLRSVDKVILKLPGFKRNAWCVLMTAVK